MTGPALERVVQIWAESSLSGTVGSGYAIGGGLVLTARHLVDKLGVRCDVWPHGAQDRLRSEVVWRSKDYDAALLRVPGLFTQEIPREILGRLRGDEPRATCRAVGFPDAQYITTTGQRDTEDIAGEVAPLSTATRRMLTVHVSGSVPIQPECHEVSWAGMSGAALFSGPLIVGILVVNPVRFGPNRLEAVPITEIAADTDFCSLIMGAPDESLHLTIVEDVDTIGRVLRPPYRPLPAMATPELLRSGATTFLLAPENGIVPFETEGSLLNEVLAWARDGSSPVALLLGPGGAGKTRTAAEVARRQLRTGAVAGFVQEGATASDLTELAYLTSPTLVVVDEAYNRVADVAALLRLIERSASLRILLIARNAESWWDKVLPKKLGTDSGAEMLRSTAEVFWAERRGRQTDLTHRQRMFANAARAFATVTQQSVGDLATPDLSSETFNRTLFVHIAALSYVDGDRTAFREDVVADDLLKFVLGREARYWAEIADLHTLHLHESLQRRAVALATLTLAASEDEAVSALAALAEWQGSPRERLHAIAHWLRELYPPPPSAAWSIDGKPRGWLYPLTPQLLAESLVAEVIGGASDFPARVLPKCPHASGMEHPRVAHACRRVGPRHPTRSEERS